MRAGKAPTKGLPVLYAQGGWRSGKTRAVLAIVLECMEAYPGLRVLIGRKDFNDLRLSTMESWREVRPRVLVKEEDKQEHRETWVNGSQVFFRELKDLEGLGGQEFGLILVSEPYELDEQLYIRLKGRLSQARMPHMLLLEGNPPNEGHWLHRMIVGDERRGIAPDPDVTFLQVPTDENWENLPGAYRRTIETAPPAWQKKYRLGQWGFVPEGQAVYDLFSEALHVHPMSVLSGRPVIRAWDSGVRHPACLWMQRDVAGRLFIQYEWLGIEIGLGEFARAALAKTVDWYGTDRVAQDIGDPAMFNRAPQTALTDAQVLSTLGVSLQGRRTTYQERKVAIDAELSRLIQGVTAIVIHPRCRTLIEGLLGGYHYPKRREGQAFNLKQQEPYKDGFYEHLVNCFEYAVVNLCGIGSAVKPTDMMAKLLERRRAEREHAQLAAAF